MKNKTTQSFFPTKITPTQYNNTHVYKVVKKRPTTCEDKVRKNVQDEALTQNIFRKQSEDSQQFDIEQDKPVGGMQIFMKELKKKNRQLYNKKKRDSAELNKESRDKTENNSRLFKRSQQQQNLLIGSSEPISRMQQKQKEQIYKNDQTYSVKTMSKWNTSNSIRPATSGTYKSNKFRDTVKHDAWVRSQTAEFQTRMGYKNEHYYKRPLVQRYGNKYFQYCMRNRHEDESAPPVYIHQIQGSQHQKFVKNDKFISKLRKMNPALKNYEMLKLKGKKIRNSGQYSSSQLY